MVCHCICCLKVRGFLGLISLLEFIGVKNSLAGIIIVVVVVAVAVENATALCFKDNRTILLTYVMYLMIAHYHLFCYMYSYYVDCFCVCFFGMHFLHIMRYVLICCA